MCFSAEASFGAAAILAVAGIVLVKKFHNSKKIFLALVPLFFAVQQFAEGFVWQSLPNGSYLVAQSVYLFFAYMFWPVWIPFSFGVLEKVRWRQVTMGVLLLMGALFFVSNGYNFLVYGNVQAEIIDHCINYGESYWSSRVLYGVITMTPFFISSLPKMWILGIANTLAFVIADISYNHAFTSVWCGMCAILTIGLFVLLKED